MGLNICWEYAGNISEQVAKDGFLHKLLGFAEDDFLFSPSEIHFLGNL